MIDHIKRMLEPSSRNSYTRIDNSHPLNIYLGTDHDGRRSLAIIVNAEREKITSSKTIAVEYFKRSDDEVMLCFGLQDNTVSDLFYKFCEDIIESTRECSPSLGITAVIDRWNTWIQFFAKTALPLSENEVLGLMGEIYFLKNVMIKKYGTDLALESYIGIAKTHKDFEIHDTWYEVKSIHSGVRSIKISSLEQLDSHFIGNLVVITFDEGTPSTSGNTTLNSIVSDFRKTLGQKGQLLFDEKMRKANYIEDERYDEYNYIFISIDEYSVAEGFPKISKGILPLGVTKASYEIDISAIQKYKVIA